MLMSKHEMSVPAFLSNIDFSEYSLLDVDVIYNNGAEKYSIIYRLKSLYNEHTIYGSVSFLLENEYEIKRAIDQYNSFIDKIDKFIPYDLFNKMQDIANETFNLNRQQYVMSEEIYDTFNKLNDKLNNNYNPSFTERLNNNILIDVCYDTLTLKVSSDPNIVTVLSSNFEIVYNAEDDYMYNMYYFIELLLNIKESFKEVIKKLKDLID